MKPTAAMGPKRIISKNNKAGKGKNLIDFPFDTHKLIEICRQNDVTTIGIFGSAVRGEATSQSDIDLLVYFSKPKSLLNVVALERQISKSLGRKVDC